MVWLALAEGGTLAEITTAAAAMTDAAPEEISEDVATLVDQLVVIRVVAKKTDRHRAERGRRGCWRRRRRQLPSASASATARARSRPEHSAAASTATHHHAPA